MPDDTKPLSAFEKFVRSIASVRKDEAQQTEEQSQSARDDVDDRED